MIEDAVAATKLMIRMGSRLASGCTVIKGVISMGTMIREYAPRAKKLPKAWNLHRFRFDIKYPIRQIRQYA
jgi:hypothetical protein